MASIPKPAVLIRVAAALALGALVLGAFSPAVDPARPGNGDEDWLKSKDPCFPVKQMKKHVKEAGMDPWFLDCQPVQIEVVWDFKHEHLRGSGLPPDRVKLRLREKFQGYLELDSNPEKKGEIESLEIVAPAPCCPGEVEASLEEISADLLACDNWGSHCRIINFFDPFQFEVIPSTDNFFGFDWNRNGQATGGFGGPRVQIRRNVFPKGLGPARGTDIANDLQINVHQPDSLSYEEVRQGLKDGEFTEVYRSFNEGEIPLIHEKDITSATATVTFTFHEPEREYWRVSVEGWEMDEVEPPISYKDPASGLEMKLPVIVEFDWKFETDIVLKKIRGQLQFDEGKITSASLTPHLVFLGEDLYKCSFVECAANLKIPLIGSYVEGKVAGKNLKITWPGLRSAACVLCTPLKSYLSKVPYRGTFGGPDLMQDLSKQNFVLREGYSTKGQISDWLRYTVSLHKIK
jgi:hypothetical protein